MAGFRKSFNDFALIGILDSLLKMARVFTA